MIDFELKVGECDLEDSDFRIDADNEMLADKEWKKEQVQSIPFETKQAVVEHWLSSKKMKQGMLQHVQRRYWFAKSMLQMLKKQMNEMGDKKHKVHEIQKFVFKKIQDVRNKLANVHDSNLKR